MRHKTLLERVEEASRQPVNEVEPLPSSTGQTCDAADDAKNAASNPSHREDFNFLLNAAARSHR